MNKEQADNLQKKAKVWYESIANVEVARTRVADAQGDLKIIQRDQQISRDDLISAANPDDEEDAVGEMVVLYTGKEDHGLVVIEVKPDGVTWQHAVGHVSSSPL